MAIITLSSSKPNSISPSLIARVSRYAEKGRHVVVRNSESTNCRRNDDDVVCVEKAQKLALEASAGWRTYAKGIRESTVLEAMLAVASTGDHTGAEKLPVAC